jgi:hypothetical protein
MAAVDVDLVSSGAVELGVEIAGLGIGVGPGVLWHQPVSLTVIAANGNPDLEAWSSGSNVLREPVKALRCLDELDRGTRRRLALRLVKGCVSQIS